MIKRKSFISAPAVLNTSDAAMWITGWNEAVDALEAEQAQAASCGYDETVGLCTSNPCCYQAAPVQKEQAVEPANWKAHIQTARNVYSDYLDVQEALNYLEQVFLAATPALHLSEILAEKGITLQKTFVEKPRDHVGDATAMAGERAELIARLIRKADAWDYLQPGAKRLNACRQAADMLEADAREIEATELQVEILSDELSKCDKAQQVAVPATDAEKMDLVTNWFSEEWAVKSALGLLDDYEHHHGITAKPSHTDWSAA